MNVPEFLETPRLFLRKPRCEDALLMFQAYAQDPAVTRYSMWRPHADISDSHAAIDRFLVCWESQISFVWFLFVRETNELIGSISARKEDQGFNIGYLLARAYWGRGLMPEAIMSVVRWAFTEPWVAFVRAYCDKDNSASARALEKAGFIKDADLLGYSVHPNISPEPRDCYSYMIPRST
ncbi:MAG TPA: GNAT family N-acetyltransferase [Chthoniobacterales bacterium]|jgi:RimJ/RimL family protein N-acetyltransferase